MRLALVAWQRGVQKPVSAESLRDSFRYDGFGAAFPGLVHAIPVARAAVNEATHSLPMGELIRWPSLVSVWIASLEEDEMGSLFAEKRCSATAAERGTFVREVASAYLSMFGRQWLRDRARQWWRFDDLIEEEQEAIVGVLAENGTTDILYFRSLGASAEEMALRIFGERGIGITTSPTNLRLSTVRRRANQTATFAAGRIETLLSPVTIDIDIRDACLEENELSRLRTCSSGGVWNEALFVRAISRAIERTHDRFVYELRDELRRLASSSRTLSTAPSANHWGFPLLRLLHLQLLLETPSLSQSIQSPEVALVPEVALYVIGRDAVSYLPELRVHQSERRWRARWVESAAESASCIFLEDALEMDLATLERIPEQSKPTPDFKAKTTKNERIVFESKGGTAWQSHLQQRKQAKKQLAKTNRRRSTTWAGKGRAFACAFFAAQAGDEHSSLFHVEDPVFAFDDLFQEGDDTSSRRNHYLGVLESARLFDVADNLVRRARREKRQIEEHRVFDLPEFDLRDERRSFVGNYLPLEQWIRQLRHPEPEALLGLRVFVGVDQQIYARLEQGEIPFRSQSSAEKVQGEEVSYGYKSGVLWSSETEGVSRGAYSLLSDGSFLAVEFE